MAWPVCTGTEPSDMPSGLCDYSKLATDMPPIVLLDRRTKYGEPGDNWVEGEETLVDWPSDAPSVRLFFRLFDEMFRLKPFSLELFARTASSLLSMPATPPTPSTSIMSSLVSVSSVPPAADLLDVSL
jgi:hypothetical protein